MSLVEATRCSAHSLSMSAFSKQNQTNKQAKARGAAASLGSGPGAGLSVPGQPGREGGGGGIWVGALLPHRKVPAYTNRSCSKE